jgi:hypothetical protein
MDHRVQGLHPPVHHFGKAGQFGNVLNRQAGRAQCCRRATGRNQFDPARRQPHGEIDDAGLVGNR